MSARTPWTASGTRGGGRFASMGSTTGAPELGAYLRSQLANSPYPNHQLLALADGGDTSTAVNIASTPELDPDVLEALLAALAAHPDVELWLALTRHRDMADMAELDFPADGLTRLLYYRHQLAEYGETLGHTKLLELIATTSGVLRSTLLATYQVCRDYAADDLLALAAGDDALRREVTELILDCGRLGPAGVRVLVEAGTLTGADALVLGNYTPESAGALVALAAAATKPTTALLRVMLESTMTFPVSADDAAAISAIKDAPVRRRVLNLVNLADHLSDATLNNYAARATWLTPRAAAYLLSRHGARLHTSVLPAILARLNPSLLITALATSTSPALAAAALNVPRIDSILVDWVTGITASRELVGLADKPLIMDLLCHHLSALDYILDARQPGPVGTLAALDLQTHLTGLVEAALGSSPAAWAAVSVLMASNEVETLPQLLGLAKTLLSAPSPT